MLVYQHKLFIGQDDFRNLVLLETVLNSVIAWSLRSQAVLSLLKQVQNWIFNSSLIFLIVFNQHNSPYWSICFNSFPLLLGIRLCTLAFPMVVENFAKGNLAELFGQTILNLSCPIFIGSWLVRNVQSLTIGNQQSCPKRVLDRVWQVF